jgi:hypothetical protein
VGLPSRHFAGGRYLARLRDVPVFCRSQAASANLQTSLHQCLSSRRNYESCLLLCQGLGFWVFSVWRQETIWGHGQVYNGGRISGRQLNPRKRRGTGIRPSICLGLGDSPGVSFLYNNVRRLERGERQEATMILIRFYHITICEKEVKFVGTKFFPLAFSVTEPLYGNSCRPLSRRVYEIPVVPGLCFLAMLNIFALHLCLEQLENGGRSLLRNVGTCLTTQSYDTRALNLNSHTG